MGNDMLTITRVEHHLSHDLPCQRCGHGVHTFLPCGDRCDCPPVVLPGEPA